MGIKRYCQYTVSPNDQRKFKILVVINEFGFSMQSIYEMSNTLQVGYNFTALSNEHCGELLTGVDIYDGFICAQGQRGQGICTVSLQLNLKKKNTIITLLSIAGWWRRSAHERRCPNRNRVTVHFSLRQWNTRNLYPSTQICWLDQKGNGGRFSIP